MKTLTIISKHATLQEAAAASDIDYSYNLDTAKQAIKDGDSPSPRAAREWGFKPTEAAYVVTDGDKKEVISVYEATGLRFIKVFSPFVSVLSNSDLELFEIKDNAIVQTEIKLPNTKGSRKALQTLFASVKHLGVFIG